MHHFPVVNTLANMKIVSGQIISIMFKNALIFHEMSLIDTTKMSDYALEYMYTVPYTVIESKS